MIASNFDACETTYNHAKPNHKSGDFVRRDWKTTRIPPEAIIALLLTNFPLVKRLLKSPLLFLPEEDEEEEPPLAAKTEGGRRSLRESEDGGGAKGGATSNAIIHI